MHTKKPTSALTTLAAALLAIHGPALAADETDLEFLTKPSSQVSIGAGYLGGDDRRQLGIIGGLLDTGGYLLLDADINKRDDADGTWMNLWISNLGMTSREIKGEYQKQGDYGVSLEYRQSKREVPYVVNTGVTGIGTTTQTVPASPPYVPGTGTNLQLGTERKKEGVGFFKYLLPNLNFKVNFGNEDKEGNRIGRVGGQPEFAAIPIDWNVRVLDASLDYVTDKLQVSGGYSGSWFTNHKDLLTANRGIAPATFYYISQPLDSEAHLIFIDGGYNFSSTTRGTFKLSYTHATQDEHIPTADIPGLASPLAPTHLDGEIDTTLIQLGLSAHPMPKLNLVANLRYHNVDDGTPAAQIVFGGTAVHSTPLSYETVTGKLEGNYNLADGYNLIAGIDYTTQDRTVPVGTKNLAGEDTERYVPMRSQLDEITYRLQLRKSMSETVNGALALLHSERDGSAYAQAINSEPGEGILVSSIDPINISDRDRNKLRATMDWVPMERANLQFNLEYARDNYGSHTLGLRDGTAWLVSVDGSYELSKDWQFTAWLSHDLTKAEQRNHRFASGTYSEAEMFDTLRDIGDSIGFGLKGLANPKLKVGADLQWTRTRSEYQQDLVPLGAGLLYEAGMVPLKDITSTLTKLSAYAQYALKKNAELRFDLIHERWKTDDWTWQFADGSPFIFGTTNDGTMVITYPKQNSTFAGVRYIYSFQ